MRGSTALGSGKPSSVESLICLAFYSPRYLGGINAARMRSRECRTMKNVMYYYNSAEGEEELHEDEEVDKLVKGGVVERNGEN
jgi:hypothetical protein